MPTFNEKKLFPRQRGCTSKQEKLKENEEGVSQKRLMLLLVGYPSLLFLVLGGEQLFFVNKYKQLP